jgi:hypothetical protein
MIRNLFLTTLALALAGSLAFAQPVIDGAIADAEYANTVAHAESGGNLYWTVDGETLHMGFTIPATGWAGIGWLTEQTNRKAGGEILIATMGDGGAQVLDMHQGDARGEPDMDTQNDFANAVAVHAGDVWTVEFSRPLATGDAMDVDVVPGTPMLFMIAHGNTMDPGRQHPRDARWYIEGFLF